MNAVNAAIIANRKMEESGKVCVELFTTLGFCHGFREMSPAESAEFLADEFSKLNLPEDVKVEASLCYYAEKTQGRIFLESFPQAEPERS